MGTVRTRPVNRLDDLEQLRQLDTSVETNRMFRAETLVGPVLNLVAVKISPSVEERFPLNLDADPWSEGWVVEEHGRIRGFIACGHCDWTAALLFGIIMWTEWHAVAVLGVDSSIVLCQELGNPGRGRCGPKRATSITRVFALSEGWDLNSAGSMPLYIEARREKGSLRFFWLATFRRRKDSSR